MMYVYQAYFSAQFSSSCLYSPGCSEMSRHLIQEFGIMKGIFLSADRLSRCNRLAAAQIHPLRINSHDGKVHETSDIYRFKAKSHKAHKHE
jgi:putative component of membrane protein insertase Oxa1/YidC/SpoIIIJ protein YidD